MLADDALDSLGLVKKAKPKTSYTTRAYDPRGGYDDYSYGGYGGGTHRRSSGYTGYTGGRGWRSADLDDLEDDLDDFDLTSDRYARTGRPYSGGGGSVRRESYSDLGRPVGSSRVEPHHAPPLNGKKALYPEDIEPDLGPSLATYTEEEWTSIVHGLMEVMEVAASHYCLARPKLLGDASFRRKLARLVFEEFNYKDVDERRYTITVDRTLKR